uniref:Uncharacterized protein n=1 Tax=Trichuris muris TaxID=70415 RepID=A0A5S6QCF1_TRIMR
MFEQPFEVTYMTIITAGKESLRAAEHGKRIRGANRTFNYKTKRIMSHVLEELQDQLVTSFRGDCELCSWANEQCIGHQPAVTVRNDMVKRCASA